MKYCKLFYLAAAILPLGAAEIPAPATEVMVFRNNNALVRYQADPKGAKVFTVNGNFSPLEGTLWSSPNVKQIRKTLSEISRKEPVPFSNITETYKNMKVTLHLQKGNGQVEKVSGLILDLYKQSQPEWNQFVTLKCSNGHILALQRSQIVGIESASLKVAEKVVKDKKQSWEFTLFPNMGGKVTFDCISKTLGWTPALKMTLRPEKKFTLSRSATVVNNGDDLNNVKCILWAGTPTIEKEGIISPMAIVKYMPPAPAPQPRMAYARPGAKARGVYAMHLNTAEADSSYAPSAPGLSENMAPFELGTLSLKKGEALVRTLGDASGSYENLVRWQIPARQGDNGRQVWKNNGNYTDNLWECLRFLNPFKAPIPDAPVEICDGTRVLAQIKGSWVNPGETATWEITRSRDVKATFAEQEAPSSIKDRGAGLFQRIERGSAVKQMRSPGTSDKDKSAPVKGGSINGIWYRVTDIKGHIELKNFRRTPVKTVIEMEYFGEFVSATENPVKNALNHFGSLNPKNKLVWVLILKPGETRKIDFRYNIIINR